MKILLDTEKLARLRGTPTIELSSTPAQSARMTGIIYIDEMARWSAFSSKTVGGNQKTNSPSPAATDAPRVPHVHTQPDAQNSKTDVSINKKNGDSIKSSLERSKPIYQSERIVESKLEPQANAIDALKPRRLTNKQMEAKLKADWRQKICELQRSISERQPEKNRGKTYPALLTVAVFGLRPCELESGICFQLQSDGSMLCSIHGAKLMFEENGEVIRGIELRRLRITPDISSNAMNLINYITPLVNSKNEFHFSFKSEHLRKFVRDLGVKFLAEHYPKLLKVGSICPYLFRHAFSSDLRSSDLPKHERSYAMGHASTVSIKIYGRTRRTKNLPPVYGFGDMSVVHSPRSDFLEKKSIPNNSVCSI